MTPAEANVCIAEKFTRVMNATPSPLAPFCDLGAASVLSGLIVMTGFLVIGRSADASLIYVVLGIAALPPVASAILAASLRHSRDKVVAWLCAVPFPVENLNALLAGLGDTLEVVFAPGAELPTRATLQPRLEVVSEDVLLVKERPEERAIEIRMGVIDSKQMPLRTNHQRWKRFVELMDRVLIPLAKTSAIERVLVV